MSVYPHIGGDSKSCRSLLSGVYARGVKDHTQKDNSEINLSRHTLWSLRHINRDKTTKDMIVTEHVMRHSVLKKLLSPTAYDTEPPTS